MENFNRAVITDPITLLLSLLMPRQFSNRYSYHQLFDNGAQSKMLMKARDLSFVSFCIQLGEGTDSRHCAMIHRPFVDVYGAQIETDLDSIINDRVNIFKLNFLGTNLINLISYIYTTTMTWCFGSQALIILGLPIYPIFAITWPLITMLTIIFLACKIMSTIGSGWLCRTPRALFTFGEEIVKIVSTNFDVMSVVMKRNNHKSSIPPRIREFRGDVFLETTAFLEVDSDEEGDSDNDNSSQDDEYEGEIEGDSICINKKSAVENCANLMIKNGIIQKKQDMYNDDDLISQSKPDKEQVVKTPPDVVKPKTEEIHLSSNDSDDEVLQFAGTSVPDPIGCDLEFKEMNDTSGPDFDSEMRYVDNTGDFVKPTLQTPTPCDDTVYEKKTVIKKHADQELTHWLGEHLRRFTSDGMTGTRSVLRTHAYKWLRDCTNAESNYSSEQLEILVSNAVAQCLHGNVIHMDLPRADSLNHSH